MLFWVENVDDGVMPEKGHQPEHEDILIEGTPVLPTSNQIDALVRLILQIVQGSQKEGQNA